MANRNSIISCPIVLSVEPVALLGSEGEDDGHRVTRALKRHGCELGNVRRRRDDAAGSVIRNNVPRLHPSPHMPCYPPFADIYPNDQDTDDDGDEDEVDDEDDDASYRDEG
eukprot:2201780-Pyramimonas_sp.AAC.3